LSFIPEILKVVDYTEHGWLPLELPFDRCGLLIFLHLVTLTYFAFCWIARE
jgi:hypothetical protein